MSYIRVTSPPYIRTDASNATVANPNFDYLNNNAGQAAAINENETIGAGITRIMDNFAGAFTVRRIPSTGFENVTFPEEGIYVEYGGSVSPSSYYFLVKLYGSGYGFQHFTPNDDSSFQADEPGLLIFVTDNNL